MHKTFSNFILLFFLISYHLLHFVRIVVYCIFTHSNIILGISLIEWPTRLGALTPDVRLEIYINIDDETGERTLTLIPHGEIWKERLLFLREEGYLDDLMMED